MMGMAVVMSKTSTVVMEDRRSSAIHRAPAPARAVRGRSNSSSVVTAEDANRGGNYKPPPVCRDERLPMPPLHTKRRREEHQCQDYYYEAAAYCASKKKQVTAEQAARVSNNRTIRQTAHAWRSRAKEESHARRGATPRREIKDRKDVASGRRSQERARMISRPRVPPPAPAPAPTPAALPDSLTAQDRLSAAIARARPALHMRREVLLAREEARRELAKMVRTVEFNDPYISPMDALKP